MGSISKRKELQFLDSHQVAGIDWILSRPASYLAHAPGAGKTAQAIIASLLCTAEGQVVFVVPPGLTKNWEREILLWTEWAGIFPTICIVPESDKQDLIDWRAEFIICPDSMLAKPWVLTALARLKKRFVGVDEASRFKEATSSRTIALFGGRYVIKNKKTKITFESPGIVSDVQHVVLMDGSPMPNRPMELWAPVFALSPETIENLSQQDFGFKYCGAKINDFGKWEFKFSSRESELRARLRRSFMHVVTESELSHPERLRSILVMDQDPRSPEHKDWEQRNLASLKDISEDTSQGALATFRRELGIRKIPWVADYVAGRLTNKNESILLFAWHREVCLGLAEKLAKFNPCLVMGGTKNEDRERYFELFQSGKRKLIVGNISAMGRGHNLQRADRVIFGEFSWTDETNTQCEKRASRKGRDINLGVRCEYIAAPNSMDEKVLAAVFNKARTVRKVIG